LGRTDKTERALQDLTERRASVEEIGWESLKVMGTQTLIMIGQAQRAPRRLGDPPNVFQIKQQNQA
jgi:hypothetical protein